MAVNDRSGLNAARGQIPARLGACARVGDTNVNCDSESFFTVGNAVSATGSTVDLPVCGRIAPHQNVRAGEFVDTVVITVSY
jgi:spore coat protein U-like protein